MSIEQELGSISYFVQRHFPSKVYAEKMPQDFAIPAVFYEAPISYDEPFTSHSFAVNYSLVIKVYHASQVGAERAAERIADKIRRARHYIPLINLDGTVKLTTRKQLFISDVNVRGFDTGAVVMGGAQITIQWVSRYHFDMPHYEKMMHIYATLNYGDE